MFTGKVTMILHKEGFNGLVERLKMRIIRRLGKQQSALTVTHEDAIKWFERRKDEYDGCDPKFTVLANSGINAAIDSP